MGAGSGLVLAAALSGLRPGQAARDYRRDLPPGGVVGPLWLCSAPRGVNPGDLERHRNGVPRHGGSV